MIVFENTLGKSIYNQLFRMEKGSSRNKQLKRLFFFLSKIISLLDCYYYTSSAMQINFNWPIRTTELLCSYITNCEVKKQKYGKDPVKL